MNGVGAQLTRNGHDAYLLLTANPANGAGSATSTLLSSSNDGASWTTRGEICPQLANTALASGEVDSTAVTAAADGSVVVVCAPRQQGSTTRGFVEVSTNGGASFQTASKTALSSPVGNGSTGSFTLSVAAATSASICVTEDVLVCSQNGGKSFAKMQTSNGGPGSVSWLGFETTNVGHAVEIGGSAANGPTSQLWTTTDAGKSWTVSTITP
jgi:hypothetical protein